MSVTKYERGNTIKTEVDFKMDGVLHDPSGATNSPCGVTVSIYKSDGTTLIESANATRDGTGEFYYYFTTSDTDPLGLYRIVWEANHDLGGAYGYMPIIQREVVNIVDTEQS